MPRAADYTIQGFLYQFNKTVLEILKAQDDETITVEGIVEDIEIATPASLTAIQCKYHEASTAFTPSAVYKPLLQMLKHFSDHAAGAVRYILFAHFPSVSIPPPAVGRSAFDAALASSDKELQKYIKALPPTIDLDAFSTRFVMEFGPRYDTLVTQVGQQLQANGISADDIETLAYPNTIHIIATLSIKHNAAARQITRRQLLAQLKSIRTTAISRWTLALQTRNKLLEARRRQLKVHLPRRLPDNPPPVAGSKSPTWRRRDAG
jgi:hypothetical protein